VVLFALDKCGNNHFVSDSLLTENLMKLIIFNFNFVAARLHYM
jgi:hypothetical protein